MTCQLSHLLLSFRPHELAADDRAALAAHVSGCPACAALAASSSATDAAVRKAMLAVPVPAGLHASLHAGVTARQSAARWRKAKGWGLGLAALIAIGVGSWAVVESAKPTLNAEAVSNLLEDEQLMKEQRVKEWLKSEGVPPELPRTFDFHYYAAHGTGPLGSLKVPLVLFQNDRGQCRVYVIKESAVRTPSGGWNDVVGSEYNLKVIKQNGYVYLIAVSTGTTLDAFLTPPPPVA